MARPTPLLYQKEDVKKIPKMGLHLPHLVAILYLGVAILYLGERCKTKELENILGIMITSMK